MSPFPRNNTVRFAAAALLPLAAIEAAELEITRSTIDGGGAMRSTGGRFELSGTIGQPDAGQSSGGRFSLTGGFWTEVERGDCDGDGVIGLLDHRGFHDCLTGPDAAIGELCRCFDSDGNGAIDLADFAEVQTRFTGP